MQVNTACNTRARAHTLIVCARLRPAAGSEPPDVSDRRRRRLRARERGSMNFLLPQHRTRYRYTICDERVHETLMINLAFVCARASHRVAGLYRLTLARIRNVTVLGYRRTFGKCRILKIRPPFCRSKTVVFSSARLSAIVRRETFRVSFFCVTVTEPGVRMERASCVKMMTP